MASFGGRSPPLFKINGALDGLYSKCNDDSHYVGYTQNFDKRFTQHLKGLVISTKYRLPVTPITKIIFTDKYKAYFFEKYLKSGSGRAFMNKRLI